MLRQRRPQFNQTGFAATLLPHFMVKAFRGCSPLARRVGGCFVCVAGLRSALRAGLRVAGCQCSAGTACNSIVTGRAAIRAWLAQGKEQTRPPFPFHVNSEGLPLPAALPLGSVPVWLAGASRCHTVSFGVRGVCPDGGKQSTQGWRCGLAAALPFGERAALRQAVGLLFVGMVDAPASAACNSIITGLAATRAGLAQGKEQTRRRSRFMSIQRACLCRLPCRWGAFPFGWPALPAAVLFPLECAAFGKRKPIHARQPTGQTATRPPFSFPAWSERRRFTMPFLKGPALWSAPAAGAFPHYSEPRPLPLLPCGEPWQAMLPPLSIRCLCRATKKH
jgi:hypothetical protein